VRPGPELRGGRVVGWIVRRAIQGALLTAVLVAVPLARAQSDAGAEPPADASRDPFREMVDSDPFAGDDPDGIDPERVDPLASEGTADLRTAALPSEDQLVGEHTPIVRGEVLEAVAGVREVTHQTRVELLAGLALVRTEIVLESGARQASEIGYRLAVPRGAVPFGLEVCSPDGRCRAGRLDASAERLSAYDAAVLATGPLAASPAPIAVVEVRDEAGRTSLWARAAPIPGVSTGGDGVVVRGGPTRRIAYAFPVPVHGGVARFQLPSRGSDVRIVPAAISVSTDDMVVPEIDGTEVQPGEALDRAGTSPTTIVARVPRTWATRAEAWSAPCGRERCVWARAMSARPHVDVNDIVLAIDASPSTASGARGLIGEAARAILAQLPSSARVRVVAFAARAEVLVGEPVSPTAIDDALLSRAVETELGSATRFEALWGAIAPWRAEAGLRVIWIGDGGMTSSDESVRAVDAARASRLSLQVVSVADREPTASLVSLAAALEAPLLQAHTEALAASRSGTREALVDRVASVLSREPAREVTLPGSRAGAALGLGPRVLYPGGAATAIARASGRASITLGPVRSEARPAVGDLALAITALGSGASRFVAADADPASMSCAEGTTALHPSATLPRPTPLPNRFARVERRSCREPAASTASTASTAATRPSRLTAATLLRSLRQRVIPTARDCFRRDRRGRAEYSTHVALLVTLADQEIVDVRAEGVIAPAFRACLVDAFEGLEVPPFEGVVTARWPLYTRPELPPPTLELHPDLATAVDAISTP